MISPSQYLNTGNFNGLLSFPTSTPFNLLGGNLAGQTYSTFPYGGTPPFVPQKGSSSIFNLPGLFGGSNQNAIAIGDTDKNQIIQAQQQPDNSKCDPWTGEDCTPSDWGKKLDNYLLEQVTPFFKNAGLLLLALILVAFGLYMLANSTKTGQTVIKVAKTAAEAAAA
jgi:hypothetical protein